MVINSGWRPPCTSTSSGIRIARAYSARCRAACPKRASSTCTHAFVTACWWHQLMPVAACFHCKVRQPSHNTKWLPHLPPAAAVMVVSRSASSCCCSAPGELAGHSQNLHSAYSTSTPHPHVAPAHQESLAGLGHARQRLTHQTQLAGHVAASS